MSMCMWVCVGVCVCVHTFYTSDKHSEKHIRDGVKDPLEHGRPVSVGKKRQQRGAPSEALKVSVTWRLCVVFLGPPCPTFLPPQWTGNGLYQPYLCLLATVPGRWTASGKVWGPGWVRRAAGGWTWAATPWEPTWPGLTSRSLSLSPLSLVQCGLGWRAFLTA